MKYLRQFMIILLFSFLGELLKYVLPFPVPASIYGLSYLLHWKQDSFRLQQSKMPESS